MLSCEFQDFPKAAHDRTNAIKSEVTEIRTDSTRDQERMPFESHLLVARPVEACSGLTPQVRDRRKVRRLRRAASSQLPAQTRSPRFGLVNLLVLFQLWSRTVEKFADANLLKYSSNSLKYERCQDHFSICSVSSCRE